jgi:hypothetical protein
MGKLGLTQITSRADFFKLLAETREETERRIREEPGWKVMDEFLARRQLLAIDATRRTTPLSSAQTRTATRPVVRCVKHRRVAVTTNQSTTN